MTKETPFLTKESALDTQESTKPHDNSEIHPHAIIREMDNTRRERLKVLGAPFHRGKLIRGKGKYGVFKNTVHQASRGLLALTSPVISSLSTLTHAIPYATFHPLAAEPMEPILVQDGLSPSGKTEGDLQDTETALPKTPRILYLLTGGNIVEGI